MKTLVTGATGLIGKALCRRLVDEGHEVTILSRHPQKHSDYETFIWDPLVGPPPLEAIQGIDGVVHLAGESVAGARWTSEKKKRIRESRVIGTRNLIAAIAESHSRPVTLISASAVGFYGDRGDELLDEQSPPGKGFLSEVCIAWEYEAAGASALGMRVAHMRTGLVLSSAGGALPRMLPAFKLGLAATLGHGQQWVPWIHLDDVVGLFLHALLTEALAGPINVAAPNIVRNEEFTRDLARILNRPSFLVAPSFALNLMLGEMAELVLMSDRVTPSRALETGYHFRYTHLKEALKGLLKK